MYAQIDDELALSRKVSQSRRPSAFHELTASYELDPRFHQSLATLQTSVPVAKQALLKQACSSSKSSLTQACPPD